MKSSHRTFGHRRTFRLAMVVWSLVLVCSTSALSATDARSKIGVLIDDARHQSNRWQQDVRFMSEWAQQRQATLMVRDGQGSQELQLAQAKELLKSTTASEKARRHAQERLALAPLAPPPSMQWAVQIKKPLPSHNSPSFAPRSLLRPSMQSTSRKHA